MIVIRSDWYEQSYFVVKENKTMRCKDNKDNGNANEKVSGQSDDTLIGETQPLLPRRPDSFLQRHTSRRCGVTSLALVAILLLVTVLPATLLTREPSAPSVTSSVVRLLSLSVWGSPASFGVRDKEERMAAIGEFIRNHSHSLDLVILQELWMRPDHARIASLLAGSGLQMTAVGDLASSVCDGRAAPTWCSGLALITRFPVLETAFQPFSVHGDFWWKDGEYWARKGIGRVRLRPAPNVTLDVFLTSFAASDYNAYYRQIQAAEFGDALRLGKKG